MAERTGLEPATPGVTGRYSNQLNYRSTIQNLKNKRREIVSRRLLMQVTSQLVEHARLIWWVLEDLNL